MQCIAITTKGTQCKYLAKNNGYCTRHARNTPVEIPRQTFTITFGDQAENHVGMVKIGTMAPNGFDLEDLQRAQIWFRDKGIQVDVYDLGALVKVEEEAYILIAKNGLSAICDPTAFFEEQNNLEKDTKALMRGKVVNKKARYNLCFDDVAVEPNYDQGQGRIVAFKDVPHLDNFHRIIPEIIGDKGINMKAEGNYYYDITKCGIGFHGDSERRRVIGIRVGAAMPLRYQWFLQGNPFGPNMDFLLENGDIYIMSSKAVGTDWKTRKIPTLRHAAGCDEFLTIKEKKKK